MSFVTVQETNELVQVLDGGDAVRWQGRGLASDAPNDEDVMAWNSSTSLWEPVDIDTIISGTYVDAAGDTMTGDLLMDDSDINPVTDGEGSLGLDGTRWGNGFFDALAATAITGTLQTAAQPNVTSLGTLDDLTVAGATLLNGAVTIGDAVGDALTITPGAWTLANAVTITGTWADLGTVTTVDINGGTVGDVTLDGTISGTPTWASTQAMNISGNAATASAVDAGNLTGTTLAANVLASSLTSLGTIAALVATTADINGGTIDGANIGVTVQGSGSFTTGAFSDVLDSTDTTQATSTSAAAIKTAGGIAALLALRIGGVGYFGSATSGLGVAVKRDGGGNQIGFDVHNSGTAAGDDAVVKFQTQGNADWTAGIDRSVAGYVIARGANLATNPVLTMLTASGAATFASSVTSTGDLTVGADKVVMTASTGAATFAGVASIGFSSAPSAQLEIRRDGLGDQALLRLRNDSTNSHYLHISVNDDNNIVDYDSAGTNAGAHTFSVGGDLALTIAATKAATFAGVLNADAGINLTGTLTIGGDANLYRSAANVLKTDDALTVANACTLDTLQAGSSFGGTLTVTGDLTIGSSAFVVTATTGQTESGGQFRVTRSTSALNAFAARVTADAVSRFTINASGLLSWGNGTDALDTTLSRSAANSLTTGGTFTASDFIGTIGATTPAAGAFTDGTFSGQLGVGVAAHASIGLDIIASAAGSAFRLANSASDTTNKSGKLGVRHYTNAEEDVMGFFLQSTTSLGNVFIGGGQSSHNAATNIKMYAAANTTTVTGTEIFSGTVTGCTFNQTLTSTGDFTVGASKVVITASTGALAMDGPLTINSAILAIRASAGGNAFQTKVTGDADNRWIAKAGGTLEWGNGTDALDTNLYRSAANTLKTDDAFTSTGLLTASAGITVTSGSVRIVDASIARLELYEGAGSGADIYFDGAGNLLTFALGSVGPGSQTVGFTMNRDTRAAVFAGAVTSTGDLTVGASKLVVTASTGVITTALSVSHTGPHAIGTATAAFFRIKLGGNFTAVGGSRASMLSIADTLTGANGNTTDLSGMFINANITTQGNSETIGNVAQLILDEPNINIGAGDTVTDASTLLILGAPDEGGTGNWAIRSVSGAWYNGGAFTQVGVFTASTSIDSAFPNTVSGTGLMVTTNDGSVQEIMRDSSTRREKLDIRVAEIDPAKVLGIYAQEYGREAQPGLRFTGFCVEDFHKAGFGTLLDYNELGQPTAFREYGRGITALQQVVLQHHESEIDQLKARVAELETQLERAA